MNVQVIFMIFGMFSLVMFLILLFQISKGIGFKMFLMVFKLRKKVSKGWGFVKILETTGAESYYPYDFKKCGSLFIDGGELGKDVVKGLYIWKKECLAAGFLSIPTITYRRGDADPINPHNFLSTVTSPEILEQRVESAVLANKLDNKDIRDLLKENWMPIGMGVLILVGMFFFYMTTQSDALQLCYSKVGTTFVGNVTSLGK